MTSFFGETYLMSLLREAQLTFDAVNVLYTSILSFSALVFYPEKSLKFHLLEILLYKRIIQEKLMYP